MAEVFSINGPPDPRTYGRRTRRIPTGGRTHFGAFGACPAGFVTTPNQNCQGAAAKTLQNALRALGNTVRDGVLMNLSADGSIGPSTASGVNRAFTTHIGPGQAPAQYRTGALSIMDIAANAAMLTQLINNETTRRGGSTKAPAAPRPATVPAYVPPGMPGAADGGGGAPSPSFFSRISPMGWVGIGAGVIVLGVGIFMFASSGPSPAPQYEPGGGHVVRAGRGRYAVV